LKKNTKKIPSLFCHPHEKKIEMLQKNKNETKILSFYLLLFKKKISLYLSV